ncbi:MAG: IS4 family transposase [Thermodesulfovibrionales bacterium]|nr:IS4 family transposase [Thermodesulfovibrionales bacterium]
MPDGSAHRGKRHKKNPIPESVLRGFKYFKVLSSILERLHSENTHHNRELYFDQYIAMLLFYFFNPVVTSLRAIQQVSELKKVQKVLGVKRTSLGSLSEASNVFDSQLIAPILQQLAEQAIPLETDSKLKGIEQMIVAVDGTLVKALSKMLWALWLDDEHRAAKIHLEFDIIKSVPVRAEVTDANANEKNNLRKSLGRNKFYILDAGYGQYSLFEDIHKAGSNFLVRLRDNAVWQSIEERVLTETDRSAGVQRDMIVRLGSPTCQDDLSSTVRVIEIYHRGLSDRPRLSRVSSKKTFRTTDSDYTMLLVTDRMDLSAEIIALLYRYRWQIELFFRWFKCILGCSHLLSLSENGVSMQVYCALIASMLITIWTGRKPTKRTFEMLCYHFMGWADDEELFHHLEKLQLSDNKKKTN